MSSKFKLRAPATFLFSGRSNQEYEKNWFVGFKQSFFTFLKEYQWAILAGIFTGTSYIPFLPWAILFNFAPLWWYWVKRARSYRQVLISGWICQFLFNLIGFHWVFHTAKEFGHIPWPLSIVVLLLFAGLAHLYVPLVGVAFFTIKEKFKAKHPLQGWSALGLIFALASLWALAEIYWPYLFQWHMGYTLLWANLPIYHWADVIGFQGLAFVLLIYNGFFTWLFLGRRDKLGKKLSLGSFLLLNSFAILNFLGRSHGRHWIEHQPEKTVRFLAVQANIGNAEKIMAERGYGYQDYIVNRFLTLSEQALAKYPEGQILVWPESAIPDYLDQDYASRPRPALIRKFLVENRMSLIAGGYSRDYELPNNERTYNALFILGPKGDLLAPPYRKKHLLAFGEYTPFSNWFPQLNEISPSGKGFDRGPGPQTLTLTAPQLSTLKVAPQICYESLYPDFARNGVLNGAQILINVTNDSWFGNNFEPYQHLWMTFARAIENRRPLLRVTNTGFTSAIEASGQTLDLSPLFDEWSYPLSLHYDQKPSLTLFTRYGDLWPIVVVVVFCGGLAGVIYGSKTEK